MSINPLKAPKISSETARDQKLLAIPGPISETEKRIPDKIEILREPNLDISQPLTDMVARAPIPAHSNAKPSS